MVSFDGYLSVHGQLYGWESDFFFCCWWKIGAIGAEFLKAFKGYIENPTSMLL
jgi:hypothetical protein